MHHTLIIAEAGVNHNGSVETAKKLIDAAADAGADIVKFQTFKTEKLVSKFAQKADYQKRNMHSEDNSQFEMLKKLELSYDDHRTLIDYCHSRGIRFLSTAFDMDSIDFLASLHLGLWKIPSGEITNYLYIKKIAQAGEPVVLSTGMCDEHDIQQALDVLIKYGVEKKNITVLHCNTDYPTAMRDVNLKAMCTIADHFKVSVGYSDHTLGIEVPIAAVALGATVIEKHFTLSREMQGPDHAASLEPQELKLMVKSIRNIEEALGSEEKRVSPSEEKNMAVARKSLVAARDIACGELYSEINVTVKRPGNGISPMRWEEVVGTPAPRDYKEDELIEI